MAESRWFTLVPFDHREGLSLKKAAGLAGKSEATVRTWCQRKGIGRRVAGGTWVVSRVALRMLLDGNEPALRAYLDGDRMSEVVASYYRKLGLEAALSEMSGSCCGSAQGRNIRSL
jgi:hypothetical protein